MGGIALLTWVTYLWLTPGEPPYQSQLIAEGKASEFPELNSKPRRQSSSINIVRTPEMDNR